MRKKWNDKKLTLNRETLRTLSNRAMEAAAGGNTTLCGGTSSGQTCTDTLVSDCHCPTQANTCTC